MRAGKFLGLAASLVLLGGCMPAGVNDGGREPDVVIVDADVEEDIPKFGAEEIYQEVVKGLREYRDSVKFKGDVDFEDVDLAVNYVIRRDPEFFWVTGYEVSTNGRETEITIDVLDSLSVEERFRMQQEIEMAADSVVAMIPAGADIFDKVVFVHDYIIDTTDYDHVAATTLNMDIEGTAYGCLVQREAVCQGYSQAFMYIMKKLGINCGMVSGNTERGPHAWNYVYINGGCYWIDLTWDDPSSDVPGERSLSHAYCLINDDMLLRSRTIDYDCGDVPVCNSMVYNYFVWKNAYFYEYDMERIGQAVDARASERMAELMFSSQAVFESALDSLLNKGDLWEASTAISYENDVRYFTEKTMFVLRLYY